MPPIKAEPIATIKTPAALRSFISFILGLIFGSIKSQISSMAVLKSSVESTATMLKVIIVHSIMEIEKQKPRKITIVAAVK